VHRHRQLDEQVGAVLRQRCVGGASGDRAHSWMRPHAGGSRFLAREVPSRKRDCCQQRRVGVTEVTGSSTMFWVATKVALKARRAK
jgi:hypothetical protein